MIFKLFSKFQKQMPKNLIGYDYKNINRNKDEELFLFNKLKEDLSEKIYRLNELKIYKLNKAVNVINEYNNLEKDIWG